MSPYETAVLLDSDYSWLHDYDAGPQASEYHFHTSTHTCSNGGDGLASSGPSAVAQETSHTSAIQTTNDQQPLWIDYPALPVDQSIDFAALFSDTSVSYSTPNLDHADVSQDVESLLAFRGYAPAQQNIDAESFYRDAAPPPIDPFTDAAIVGQDTNPFDTNVALSMQHTLDIRLRDELEGFIWKESSFEFEAGSETESRTADKGLQLNQEQPQQNEERLNKQDERIQELELALQQLQQTQPELPQAFTDIPRQWVEVQTNVEQYLKRFTDWAEEHRHASAGDTAHLKNRVKELETEVQALRQCIDRSS